MINHPIIKNIPPKGMNIIFLSLCTIMYIALCAEADMYVPAFPQMIKFFGVEESRITLILSINFAGLCISGLVTGPLSDTYGRRKVLLGGVLVFMISSLGCVITDSFGVMLFWRLVQGIAASIPMVVAAAALFDKYKPEEAGQLLGILNSVISASMAGAPIVGAWVSEAFNWRANFVVILSLAVVSFLGTVLFFEESLPFSKRKAFKLRPICNDYFQLGTSFAFLGYTVITTFPLASLVLFVGNLSLILVNHLGIDLVTCSYYQGATTAVFVVFSLISVKLIRKKGVDYTKHLGGIIALIGSTVLLLFSLIDPTNVNMIVISMSVIVAGGAFMVGTFGPQALTVYPDMNGTSMAMMTAIRQLLCAGLVFISEIYFNGTIVPVATIIAVYAVICAVWYWIMTQRRVGDS